MDGAEALELAPPFSAGRSGETTSTMSIRLSRSCLRIRPPRFSTQISARSLSLTAQLSQCRPFSGQPGLSAARPCRPCPDPAGCPMRDGRLDLSWSRPRQTLCCSRPSAPRLEFLGLPRSVARRLFPNCTIDSRRCFSIFLGSPNTTSGSASSMRASTVPLLEPSAMIRRCRQCARAVPGGNRRLPCLSVFLSCCLSENAWPDPG